MTTSKSEKFNSLTRSGMFLFTPLEKNSFTFSYTFSCVVKSNFQVSVRGIKGLPCFFSSRHCVIGPENLRPFWIQLDAKVQRKTWSLVNSCVICSFLVFCLCFHQLVVIFSYLLIGCRDYFSFYSTTRNRKCSIIDKRAVTYLIRKLISRVPHDRLYEAASMARSHSSSASPSARSWEDNFIL